MNLNQLRHLIALAEHHTFSKAAEALFLTQPALSRSIQTLEQELDVKLVDRDGKRIFVAANKAKTLEVFDAKSFDKIKDIPTGNRCWHFTFTPDDKQILLACGKSDEVLVIDADKLEVTKRIGDKKMPWGLVTYPKSMGSLDQP